MNQSWLIHKYFQTAEIYLWHFKVYFWIDIILLWDYDKFLIDFLVYVQMIVAEYIHAKNTGEPSRVLLGFNIPAFVWTAYCKVKIFIQDIGIFDIIYFL